MKKFKEYIDEANSFGAGIQSKISKRVVFESTEELKDGKWTLKHIGTADGKPYGLGGPVHVYTGHSEDYIGTTNRYYIQPERTGKVRLVSSDHPIVRKCVMDNK
jgi:hypothetical protein